MEKLDLDSHKSWTFLWKSWIRIITKDGQFCGKAGFGFSRKLDIFLEKSD